MTLSTELMSGPSGVMDWCAPPKLKLLLSVFLLVSTNNVCLHGHPITGVDHNLRCVNNFLFSIHCSLSIASSENTSDSNNSYWLTFLEIYKLEKFVCILTHTDGGYICSVITSNPIPDDDYYPETFEDTDTFKISLCHNQDNRSETCELLEERHTPRTNIKPNAPCCLTVKHNSGQHHFTWKSTYEEYGTFFSLIDNLKYQLHYYKRGDKHNVISREIYTDSMNYSVDDQQFVPYTEWAARVRTSPNLAFYSGQWSDWSPVVHWKLESAVNDIPSNTFVSRMSKVFIPLCVMLPLVLVLLCYASVKKWRQSAFIPTPAPYFHTLYSDCQGDFKSWVVTQKTTPDMLKAEETLQIDKVTKRADTQEEECLHQFHHRLMEGSPYSNVTDSLCGTALLGVPYAMSTIAPLTSPGSSLKNLTLSSQTGSPIEGDSGCWFCSYTSLERDPPFYCNEYCTLSAFQQISPVIGEHHESLSTKTYPTGMIRMDKVSEA